MFKRMRWIGAGAIVGVGASVWTQRKARTVAARYRPAGRVGAAGAAQQWPARVRAAVGEGRRAMQEREAELRRRLEPPEGRPAIGAGSQPRPPGDGLAAGRARRVYQ
jgi:hypothetical protein